LVSPMASFPQASPPTPCVHPYPPPYAPHALPISFVSILPRSFSITGWNLGWITSESGFDCHYGHRFSQLHPGRRIQENCVPLGYYAANSVNFLLTFRDNPSVPSSRIKNPKRKPTRRVIGSTLLSIHLIPGDTFSDARAAAGWY
jgi:hypothetical protein